MRLSYPKWAGLAGLLLLAGAGAAYGVRGVADWGLWVPLALAAAGLGWYASAEKAEALAVVTSRRSRQGANSVVYTLAVLAMLTFGYALASNFDTSWDLSKGKTHTLADETLKAVKALDKDVMIYAFFGMDNSRGNFEDLLKRVKKLNPGKLKYDFVDLNKRPLLAQQYAVRSLGTTVIVCGDKNESITSSKEEDLLNALVKVSSSGTKQVYFVSGHQERGLADTQGAGASELKKALDNATFASRELNLASQAGGVPADAAAVVIAGPNTDYLAPELEALTKYLGRGGRLIVAVDPRMRIAGLLGWLAKAGVRADEDIVVDFNPMNQLFGGSPIAPLVSQFDASHAVTRDMRGGQIMFPQGRSLSLQPKLPEGWQGTALAKSMPTAWGWVGAGSQVPTKPSAADKRGPLDLIVALEGPAKAFDASATDEKRARLVVFGTSQMLANQLVVAFNNQDFIVNSIRWLADEEKRIALAPKSPENSPLLLESSRLKLVWWSFILLSLAALGSGIAVTVLRRRAA